MIKAIRGWGSLFILASLVSAIAHLPLSVVLNWFTLPDAVQLRGVNGSLWQGRIQQVSWQQQALGSVEWSLNGWQLFMGRIEAETRFGHGSRLDLKGKGVVGLSFNGIYIQNAVISVPMGKMLQLVTLPVPMTVSGMGTLSIKELNTQGWQNSVPECANGQAELVWNAAQAQTPLAPLVLDTVTVHAQCDDGAIHLQGRQESAQVQSEFSMQLQQPDKTYSFRGWFKPQAEFPESLHSLLSSLPKPDEQGRFSIQQHGQWP